MGKEKLSSDSSRELNFIVQAAYHGLKRHASVTAIKVSLADQILDGINQLLEKLAWIQE
jgi:hypothetical protein